MSKKGPAHAPPPEFKIEGRYGHKHLSTRGAWGPVFKKMREDEQAEVERERKLRREIRRRWRIFWWACAAAACCVYWLWWLWPTAEPVKWSAFG